MEKIWIILLAIAIFLLLNFLFYKSLIGYVKEEFGKKMWTLWGNKMYFWQSAIFVSTAGTALIMYLLLQWLNQ